MTRPSPQEWDGSGPDPWMPQRLQQQAQVAVGERTIYDDYYARLAAWLAFAGQATMSGVVPNPDAILNLAPRWVQSMTDFVHDSIAELVGKAYVSVFGPGYRYDNRPFVVDYLARATNRLVEVPDQTYTLITSQIAEGAMAGESIAKIRDRVRESFDVSGTSYWQNRPTVVARSEVVSALNAGRQGAFTEVAFDLGEPFEKGWLATTVGAASSRTRPTHRAADIGTPVTGQRVPLDQPFIVGGFPGMFPGAPELPPEESIQCVPAETLVSYPGLRAVMQRSYRGDMVKISFASGDELSITPNHPVLRADGIWTPAGLLNEGDHCIRSSSLGHSAGAPDEDGGPTKIGDVHRAAQISGIAERVRGVPPDFHGDGVHGEVEVVAVDRSLRVHVEAASDEEIEEFGLALASLARPSLGSSDGPTVIRLAADGDVSDDVNRAILAVCPVPLLPTLARREARCVEAVELGTSARLQADFAKSTRDYGSTDAQGFRNSGDGVATLVPARQVGMVDVCAHVGNRLSMTAHAGAGKSEVTVDRHGGDPEFPGESDHTSTLLVEAAKIVKIERYAFTGHVYNLDTGEGWYVANSVVIRNCRCTQLILRPGESIDLSGRQFTEL